MDAGASTRWVCGTLGRVHGLAGELYLNLAPAGLEYLEGGERFYVADEKCGEERACRVRRAGGSDALPLVALDLAACRDEAIALQGLTLIASGGSLDDRPHYRVGDLIGRTVRVEGGAVVGEVADVVAAPAHEVLELRPTGGGAAVLVPLVTELVWEAADGCLTVRAGLLATGDQAVGGGAAPRGADDDTSGGDGGRR